MLHHYAAGRQTAASIPRGSIVAPYYCVGNMPRERREKGQWDMTTWDGPTYERLEAKRKRLKDKGKFGEFPSVIGLRARRCTSWLRRAEQEMARQEPDYDAAFIFYWIAFNAAYADGRTEMRLERRETEVFAEYFGKIIQLDHQRKVYNAVWEQCWEPMVGLLKNKYVFGPFWDFHNGLPGNDNWRGRFDGDVRVVGRALDRRDTKSILRTLFYRLYVLRNQLVHGGATWQGSVNRRQVEDGARILAFLVPLFIDLMMSNPEIDWGVPPYPVVT